MPRARLQSAQIMATRTPREDAQRALPAAHTRSASYWSFYLRFNLRRTRLPLFVSAHSPTSRTKRIQISVAAQV